MAGSDMALECVTASTRADLDEEASAAFRERWPEFIFHDPISRAYVDRAERYFPEYQILVLDDGRVAAGGWGVPFAYDGRTADLPDGYDGALVRAIDGHEAGTPPTAFSFMAAAVHRDYDKRGLAEEVLRHLTSRARDAGLTAVFAPIRPTWKSRYPTVPMARYATWRRADGLSIDPWTRTHQRMGARTVGAAHRSMVIPGTVAEWETSGSNTTSEQPSEADRRLGAWVDGARSFRRWHLGTWLTREVRSSFAQCG